MTDAELKRLRKRVANQARAAGRFQATAEIVAWLRTKAIPFADGYEHELADLIERRDHLKPTPGTEPKGDE